MSTDNGPSTNRSNVRTGELDAGDYQPDISWYEEAQTTAGPVSSYQTVVPPFGTNSESGGCIRCKALEVQCDENDPCSRCIEDNVQMACCPKAPATLPSDPLLLTESRRYSLSCHSYLKERKAAGSSKKTITDFFAPKENKASGSAAGQKGEGLSNGNAGGTKGKKGEKSPK
ncbi:hypothetical protein IAU59_000673 [Kwoniella sp. CBS 9459]